jgi:predicted ester cyclase
LKEADLAVVDELFAPNFQHYQPSLPVFISGSRDVRLRLSVYHLAFPDLHYTVEALVAEGDQVVARWQARGTHSGKFGLHTPTGEQMTWAGMTIWRIADGQIVEAWTIQQGPTFF